MPRVRSALPPLTRREPIFRPPGSDDGRPISHASMNCGRAFEVAASRGMLELRRGTANSWVEVEGVPFDKTRRLSSDDLRRGLLLTVGGQFVFCLHCVHFPIPRGRWAGRLECCFDLRPAKAKARPWSGAELVRRHVAAADHRAKLARRPRAASGGLFYREERLG
jgi:hypothetical protein